MVSLTRSLFQMPRVRVVLYNYDQICRGKDAIKDILPLTIMNIKKPPKTPAPGFKIRYTSVLLGRTLRLRVTLGVQRAIDRIGGFDRYIYYTPEKEFRSQLALSLKRRMQELVAEHPEVEPPPLNKRNPKPIPKNLTKGLDPIEVCDVNKFVYLG